MFRDYGLELLDNNYIDKKTMLKCKTGDGYIIIFSIYNVINKNKIFIVHRDNPYSIYNIRIYMSQFNPTSKLVSENYINNTEKLTFIGLILVLIKKYAPNVVEKKSPICKN